MKSRIFGVLTCASFILTSAAYLSFSGPVDKSEDSTSSPNHRQTFEYDQAYDLFKVQASSMVAVGWKGCPWCQKLKDEVLPVLVEEGYDVRYLDRRVWDGPRITIGPTLFFMDNKSRIIKVYKGYLSVEEIKENMVK